MLTLKNSDRNTAVSIKVKKALVQRSIFPKPPTIIFKPLLIPFGLAHIKITKEMVA